MHVTCTYMQTKREIQQLVEKMYTKVDGRTKDKLSRLEGLYYTNEWFSIWLHE